MKINMYGQTILSSDKLLDLLLQGKNISHLNVVRDEDLDLYEKYKGELLDNVQSVFLDAPDEILTFDDFHKERADEWIFPIEYQQLDVLKWLLDKCKTQVEIDRVNLEYGMYKERELVMLIRLFIFLVDYLRKSEFIWGVGRGSSVSSYILYLIGVHRIDSLKYNLPISDFLR